MRAHMGRVAVLAALALGAGTSAAVAAPGDLDASYGDAGKLTIDLGADEGAFGLQLQPDGKLVLGGYAGPSFAAFRLNADGSRDNAFSADGVATVAFATPARGRAVALQGDGRIVLAGQTLPPGGGDDVALARLAADGSLDGNFFDATGKRTLNLFGADGAAAVLIQPDGRIVVAGQGGANTNMIQARFTAAGGVDATFAGGLGNTGQDQGGSELGFGAALQEDGKIITVGSTSRQSELAFSRINADGSPDKTIEADGNLSFGVGGNGVGRAVAVLPDGKILVAGRGGADNDMLVLKLNPDATTDRTFGTNGSARIDLGGVDDARAMAVQANGKIVLAGSTTEGNDMVVVRLQPGGTLDTTFGQGGKVKLDFGRLDTAFGVALQADGKIVVAGVTGGGAGTEDVAVARVDGGEPDSGGGPGVVGAKVYRCGGKRATIIGTNRRNRLRGTRRSDVIVALGGNDKVDGRGGNDVICAGSGNDAVVGGPGKDRLFGDSGKDSLKGGSGNDSLDGGSGNDKLFGESGKDTLRGRSGRDRLSGGPGRDRQTQ